MRAPCLRAPRGARRGRTFFQNKKFDCKVTVTVLRGAPLRGRREHRNTREGRPGFFNFLFFMKIADRLQNENRSLIDPDQIFNRDRDRDLQMKIANRFENQNRDPIMISKSLIDFRTKIGSRYFAPLMLLLLKPVFNRRSISK
jgi:hypothetical protein